MIYKTKEFQARFKKADLDDSDLEVACDEIAAGLVDADLGSHLYKKRIAKPGKGKSGGYRTMVGAVINDKYFFLYMFEKNAKSNINKQERIALKELAKELVGFNQMTIGERIASGELVKVDSEVDDE